MKDIIPFSDFSKLDLRVGEIKEASEVEGSNKLLKLTVFFGEEIGTRTIFAGVRAWYEPTKLVGRKLIFVLNLAPKKFVINGLELESQGMLMAAGDDFAALYTFDRELEPGTTIH